MSDLKRLIDLPRNEAVKIRRRQMVGVMKEIYDEENYLCYSEEDLRNYKPSKVGRKPKPVAKFSGNPEEVSKKVKDLVTVCHENGIYTLKDFIEFVNCALNESKGEN